MCQRVNNYIFQQLYISIIYYPYVSWKSRHLHVQKLLRGRSNLIFFFFIVDLCMSEGPENAAALFR